MPENIIFTPDDLIDHIAKAISDDMFFGLAQNYTEHAYSQYSRLSSNGRSAIFEKFKFSNYCDFPTYLLVKYLSRKMKTCLPSGFLIKKE